MKHIVVLAALLLLFCSTSVAQSPSPSPKPSDPCPVFHHRNIPDAQWDFYPSLGILSAPSNSGTELEMKDWKKSADCVKEWVAKTCPYPRCSSDDQRRLEMCAEGLNDKDWCDALRKRLGIDASPKEAPHTPEKAK